MKSKLKIPKARKGAWFVKVRGSYLPVSRAGWLTYVPLVLFATAMMILAVMTIVNQGDIVFTMFELLFGYLFLWAMFTWLAITKS